MGPKCGTYNHLDDEPLRPALPMKFQDLMRTLLMQNYGLHRMMSHLIEDGLLTFDEDDTPITMEKLQAVATATDKGCKYHKGSTAYLAIAIYTWLQNGGF